MSRGKLCDRDALLRDHGERWGCTWVSDGEQWKSAVRSAGEWDCSVNAGVSDAVLVWEGVSKVFQGQHFSHIGMNKGGHSVGSPCGF